MHPITSRRALLRAALGVAGTLAITPILAACGQTAAPAKPAETKPAETKPAAPAAQPAATAAPAAQPAAPAKAAAGTELRLHLRVGPEEDTMKEVLPAFTQRTGINIKLESFPTNEYFAKIQTLIAGDQVGDVLWTVNYVGTFRWASSQIIRAVDDLAAAEKYDTSQFYPAAWEAGKYQGQMYGLPFKIHPGPSAFYYNANAAKEAGVTFPEKQMASWDDVIKNTKAMVKSSGPRVERHGFSMSMSVESSQQTWQVIQMYLRSYGGEYYSEDGKTAQLNTPQAKEAIRFMHALMHQHKVAAPQQEWTNPSEDLFIAERSAGLQGSSSLKSLPTKVKDKFEVKNVMLPPGPGGKLGTQAIVDHIVMSAKTQKAPESWELMKLLCGKEVGVRLGAGAGGQVSGTSGGRLDVLNDPQLMANPLHPIFLDLLSQVQVLRLAHNFRDLEVAQALHQTSAPLWLGERQPDDAFFDELNKAVQAVLDKPV
jgi:multiple sugar transport system substrate-binding protein